jgi:hypothetical protein
LSGCFCRSCPRRGFRGPVDSPLRHDAAALQRERCPSPAAAAGSASGTMPPGRLRGAGRGAGLRSGWDAFDSASRGEGSRGRGAAAPRGPARERGANRCRMRRRAPFSLMRPPQRSASMASRCERNPPQGRTPRIRAWASEAILDNPARGGSYMGRRQPASSRRRAAIAKMARRSRRGRRYGQSKNRVVP